MVPSSESEGTVLETRLLGVGVPGAPDWLAQQPLCTGLWEAFN